jgi:hypothetical protein
MLSSGAPGGKVGSKWSELGQIQAGHVKLLVNSAAGVNAVMVVPATERI